MSSSWSLKELLPKETCQERKPSARWVPTSPGDERRAGKNAVSLNVPKTPIQYANTIDGLMHTIDDLGNDIPIGGNAPQFLNSLVVNTLSQGDSALLTNYTFPKNKPPPDFVFSRYSAGAEP